MKFIYSLLIALICAITVGLFPTQPVHAAGRPAIFYTPHQDDETLSMGAAIRAHLVAGREVIVVLATSGQNSGVRTGVLKQKLGRELSYSEFSAARDAEFKAALIALGVKPANIKIETINGQRPIDGSFTQAQAGVIIDKYIAMYPNGSHLTMSWLDAHSDHYVLGYVLNNRCEAHKIANDDCRFYQSRLYWTTESNPIGGGTVTPRYGFYTGGDPYLTNAINQYKLYNPSIGRYGIGYLSVKSQFDRLSADKRSKWHMNNINWYSQIDHNAANNWRSRCQSGGVPNTLYPSASCPQPH